MIIASGKDSGKRLIRLIAQEIEFKGYAEVAALSDLGVQKINIAGQKLANAIGRKVEANPSEREIELGNGLFKLALVITIKIDGFKGATITE